MTLAAAHHPLCALVADTHPLAQQGTTSLAECSHYPWAVPDRTLAARHLLDLALEHSNLRVAPIIESNSIETLKAYVRRGEAVCFSFDLGQNEDSPGLTALTLRNPHCAEAKLFLATRRGRTLPVAAAAFAEQLKLELEHNLTLRLMSPV
jgi:DNA-binding transcriptional LysR family regulator